MNINERYLPGGDKYESITEDDRRPFYERVQAKQEEIVSGLKSLVSCWTENEIEDGNEPSFENFRDMYPEWDVESLYEIIGDEMERVRKVIESEKRGCISGVS